MQLTQKKSNYVLFFDDFADALNSFDADQIDAIWQAAEIVIAICVGNHFAGSIEDCHICVVFIDEYRTTLMYRYIVCID